MTENATAQPWMEPDLDGASITWDRVRPHLSLRLFRLPGAIQSWKETEVSYALALQDNVVALVEHHPPAARSGRSSEWTPVPEAIHIIGGVFFDLRSRNLVSRVTLTRQRQPAPDRLTEDHFFLVGAWYRLVSVPPWLRGAGTARQGLDSEQPTPVLQDVTHHLLMFSIIPPFVGVLCTHRQLQETASAFVEEGQSGNLRLPVQAPRIPDEELQDAFVRGPASQLWLNGLHRTVASRPDRKTLAGEDLRQALDPFADQSFSFGAIVSELADLQDPALPEQRTWQGPKRTGTKVGLSRSTGTVWQPRQVGTIEFGAIMSQYRDILCRPRGADRKRIHEERMGLNYLSQPVSADVMTEIGKPFEARLDLNEPENLSEAPLGETSRDQMLWNARGRLQLEPERHVVRHNVMAVPMLALFDEKPVARLTLKIGAAEHDTVKTEVGPCEPIGNASEGYDILDRLIYSTLTPPFSVKFESGHVLTGRHLYRPSFRDVLFRRWAPVRLKDVCGRDFEAWREKPEGWDRQRLNRKSQAEAVAIDTSLFARVAATPRELFPPPNGQDGEWYLLCHDQPNEVADFVFFEPAARALTLAHVKGAEAKPDKSKADDAKAKTRRISIGAYEVVVAQAIKNLRHFDSELLLRRLKASRKHDREIGVFLVRSADIRPSENCEPIMTALSELSLPIVHKRVVIFQPQVLWSTWQTLRAEIEGSTQPLNESRFVPAFMLSSLLINAQIDCLKQGIDFEVWCEDDVQVTAPPPAGAADRELGSL